MDAARDLAENGAVDRTLVRADIQTGARGRYGRPWTSQPGNLFITAVLRETRPMADCAFLSFVAALALKEAVACEATTLKWPNDVLIRGKKCAGILLESGGAPTAPWILIGIGVNVGFFPSDIAYPATSLSEEGSKVTPDELCRSVTEGIDRWRGIWHKHGAAALLDAWTAAAQGIGQEITVRLQDRRISGVFERLDSDGALIVLDDAGLRHRVTAGDVFFS